MPACQTTNNYLLNLDLKEKIKKAEEAGIEVIGVGMLSDSPLNFYPSCTIIKNIDEISSKIYEALLKKIRN